MQILERAPPRIAKAYDQFLQPNVLCVLHLQRSIDGHKATPSLYQAEAIRFLERVTKAVVGKNAWRRRRREHRLLNCLVTVERADEVPHLNVLLRKPDAIEFLAFREIVQREWGRSEWGATGDGSFYCEPREPGSAVIGYIMKEGADSILLVSAT